MRSPRPMVQNSTMKMMAIASITSRGLDRDLRATRLAETRWELERSPEVDRGGL